MELRDLIVTPIVLIIVYLVAYRLRPRFTDVNTRRYFIPALTVRIIGAIAVGLIYQFYYGGGDTFTYHTNGSTIIWKALIESPRLGLKLMFAGEEYDMNTYQYAINIYSYGDLPSYFVVRVTAFFDIITFNTYSATAVLFGVLSFSGAWVLYMVFYERFPTIYKSLSIACLFMPSVFFWGSGILKDTLTLAAIGFSVYAFSRIFFNKKSIIKNTIILFVSFIVMFIVKKYILLCLIPALIAWVYIFNMAKIKKAVLRLLLTPIVLSLVLAISYLAIQKVGEDDPRYAIDKIAETAKVTAYDIAFWTGRNAGSTYNLGELDGSFSSMLQLMPSAVNVTLFRPYIWEVRNPLMLLAATETFIITVLTIFALFKSTKPRGWNKETKGIVLFCFIFSFTFAFAVGVSTYNFGTLMRYKIPLMPFFTSILMILIYSPKRDEKLA